jgi:hypothetical protein
MAEIQKRTETVVQNFYRLDLSQEEAEVVYAVLGKVSGPIYGFRGVSQGVFDSLSKALGVAAMDLVQSGRLVGTLRFED